MSRIMLEMAAADEAQQMWERRYRALIQMYERQDCFVDRDGKWGLRSFLDYAGEICGFDPSGPTPSEPTP